jgi:hypothetical protein
MQYRLQFLRRVSVIELDVLDAGQRVLEAQRDRGRLEVHGKDVPLSLARQHDFLGHVMRVDRGGCHHQQQDLGALKRAHDGLAPERRAVDAALVDPDVDACSTQLAGEVEYPGHVIARVAQEYFCRLSQFRAFDASNVLWSGQGRRRSRCGSTRLTDPRWCEKFGVGRLHSEAHSRQLVHSENPI